MSATFVLLKLMSKITFEIYYSSIIPCFKAGAILADVFSHSSQ